MIAPRLSTIVNADQILVLADGNIAERGTHSQRLTYNGLYSKLWREQQKEERKTSSELSQTSPLPDHV